jgi:hypothetical protein
MGLDQYLYAEIQLPVYASLRPEYQTKETQLQDKLRTKIIKDLKLDKLLAPNSAVFGFFDCPATVTVKLECAYWRKCNQVHAFFTKGLNEPDNFNGRDIYVSRADLEELRNIILQVLPAPEKGEALLPTQGGFFFGSTDYDEYYIKDLENTLEILNRILADERDCTFYYNATW